MWLFNKKNAALDIIRCDEPSYLIWKWCSRNSGKKRENSIRFGSSLRVKSGEAAIFIYHHENSLIQEEIQGPFDKILETDNLPGISTLIEKFYSGSSPFQAEVYFINLSSVQIKFDVPYFNIYDYRNTSLFSPVSVSSSINFKINDYSEFIKIHRLINLTAEDLHDKMNDTIKKCVINTLSNVSVKLQIPVTQLERQISAISDILLEEISEKASELYGIKITNVDISSIVFNKTSDEYAQLMNYERLQSITSGS